MRTWFIGIANGFCFVFLSEEECKKVILSTGAGIAISSSCTAIELPYPFWYVGPKRNVYVREYEDFLTEFEMQNGE